MAVAEDAAAEPGAVRVEVTLPCDAQFRAMRDCVVARLTASVGYDEAHAVTRAITLATSGVLDHAEGAAYSSLMITFVAGGGTLTIRMRYLVDPGAPGAPRGPAIERILGDGGRDAPLAVLRRLAGRVEFGQVEGAECCTLVAPLPAVT